MNVKRYLAVLYASLCFVLLAAATTGRSQVLFFDNFNSGLGGPWTGQFGGPYHAVTVPDPLNSGRGNVLTFTALNAGGDIFTTATFAPSGSITVSFDYLGLQMPGSVPGDLGGFLGLAPASVFYGGTWIAGTSPSGVNYSNAVHLIDDGQWHSYSVTVNGPVGPFNLMVEDWAGSGGVPGDAYFDNIQITAVPEPAESALCAAAALAFLSVRRLRKFGDVP